MYKVILADDEPLILKGLRYTLEQEGYEIMTATDGEEALKVVRWRQNNDGSGYATADIGRIGTQQAFLQAMAQQTLQLSNWDKIPHMAEIFFSHVDTNLELANLIWIGEQALTIGSSNISFHTLPGDGTGYYNGGSYYILYDDQVLSLVNDYFNPYTEARTLSDLRVFVPEGYKRPNP